MRRILVELNRLIEARGFGIALALIALVLALLKDVVGAPPALVWAVAASSVGVAALQFARESGASFVLWRVLKPRYRGLDAFLKKIDADTDFLSSFLSHGDGMVSIDARAVVRSAGSIVERLTLCANDETLHRTAAQINATAFAGSRYQAAVGQKYERNRSIGRRHAAAIAIVRSEHDAELYEGISAVFPMNNTAVASYQTGQLSDNSVTGTHIASEGVLSAMLLAFMIGHAPVRGGINLKPREGSDVLEDLIKSCLLQLILICGLSNQQDDIFLVTANATPRMQRLFTAMKFLPRDDFRSADGERMFGAHIRLLGARTAARAIARRNSQVAEILPKLLIS